MITSQTLFRSPSKRLSSHPTHPQGHHNPRLPLDTLPKIRQQGHEKIPTQGRYCLQFCANNLIIAKSLFYSSVTSSFCRSVAYLLRCSDAPLLHCSVALLLYRSVAPSLHCSVNLSIRQSVNPSIRCSVHLQPPCSIAPSFRYSFALSLYPSFAQLIHHSA